MDSQTYRSGRRCQLCVRARELHLGGAAGTMREPLDPRGVAAAAEHGRLDLAAVAGSERAPLSRTGAAGSARAHTPSLADPVDCCDACSCGARHGANDPAFAKATDELRRVRPSRESVYPSKPPRAPSNPPGVDAGRSGRPSRRAGRRKSRRVGAASTNLAPAWAGGAAAAHCRWAIFGGRWRLHAGCG